MFDYQLEAVEWMTMREDDESTPGGFLCHEMGLGKTHIVCKHISNTIKRCARTLILTTKSTLHSWKETLCTYSNFEFDVRVNAYNIALDSDRPIVVVSTHNSVLKRLDWYASSSFDRIIVDEAHIMRNMTEIAKRMVDISRVAKYRWGVTATPFNNKDSDIRAYITFLRPTDLTPNVNLFKHVSLRKRREDVIEGGPKLIITKMVYDFDFPEERAIYEYISNRIDETHEWIARNARTLPWRVRGQMILTLMIRQRQASIHPQLVLNAEKAWARQMGDEYDYTWNPHQVTKVNRIINLVMEDQRNSKNTLIVTHFAEEMNMLKSRLIELGVSIRTLNGKTSAKQRAELETKYWVPRDHYASIYKDLLLPDDVCGKIIEFLEPKPEVVILQIQAGGVGISLPWIHHVINAAPDWNPYLEQQSIYRAYRVNTKHHVRVTSMYFKDTIELDMQKRQTEKLTKGIKWTDDPISSIEDYIRMPRI